mgnify:CR=1 FL=1
MAKLIFNNKIIFYFILSILFLEPVYASGYLDKNKLDDLNFYCNSDNLISFKCGKLDSPNKVGIVKLPVLKSVITKDGKHAFRIMPSLTNLTGKDLTGVQFELMFQDVRRSEYQLNYTGTVKNKMTTSTDRSFLIRSDVPIYSDFYTALRDAYYSREIDKISIGISQVIISN